VQWSNYKKVMLKPVEFWDNPDTSVSSDDQKMLTSYFYNSLQKNLQNNFTLVDQPGPGVITVAVAIINATGATPGLRSVSLVIPQARILNYAQSLATGHAAFAGSAEAAFKATDSSSGTLLAESVDKRIGGMAVANAAQIQWGDAEAAMIIGRCISPSARSRLERARRQQQASLRRATSLSDASPTDAATPGRDVDKVAYRRSPSVLAGC
jgi:hypothetical protein